MNEDSPPKIRINFFVKKGLDTFLNNIIDSCKNEYDVKKIIVTDCKDINEGMKDADICWFEWCDDLIAYASRQICALNKKIICRLHSYEAFTDYPANVNYDMVDKIVFVSDFMRNLTVNKFKIDKNKTIVIPNGIDTSKYNFKERKPGFNIAYAGYINYKKGPMMLLHTFKAIHDSDERYKLFIAGSFQDERDILYFSQMIQKLNLEDRVIYEGWQNNLDAWLEDKNYILCTSILESQNVSVMQAMSKGIKPIIHNFVGAENIYPDKYIFNTIDEAVKMINGDYCSQDYRDFVDNNYNITLTNSKICSLFKNIMSFKDKSPLVSVIMTVYNREKYVKEAVESVLNQTYKNFELIIVNDGSTDNSEAVIKYFDDPRIKYFKKENSGQLEALKYGFEKACGDYITRLDSDDTIDKNYIYLSLAKMIEDPSLDFVYCNFNLIDEAGNFTLKLNFDKFTNSKDIINSILNRFSSVIPDVAFWSKHYIKNVISNYTDKNIPFYINNILSCNFYNIEDNLYNYRQHDLNFSNNSNNLELIVEGVIKFIDYIIRRYFIQENINNDFSNNKSSYFYNFSKVYLNQANAYKLYSCKIITMLLNEAYYWMNKFIESCDDNGKKFELIQQFNSILEKNKVINLSNEKYIFKNMNIAVVSADNPFSGKALGGKHVHLHQLLQGFSEKGIESNLVTLEDFKDITIGLKNFENDYKVSYEKIHSMPDKKFIYMIYAEQKQLENKLRRLISSSYISCINCHDVISVQAAHRVLQEMNIYIPIVTTLHGYFTYENTDYGLLKSEGFINDYFMNYEKEAYLASDKIITVDTRIKNYVLNLTCNKIKNEITLLKNAVDDVNFYADYDNNEAFENNIIFIPRRLVPKNGVIYAVKAAHELVKRGFLDFKIVIAGDGFQRNSIEKYISDNSLENYVLLLGRIHHNDILRYYNASKIVLIPSIHSNNVEEATSLSALEGMACGKAVIASNIGGLREIIKNGHNGFLTDVIDTQALADLITSILKMDSGSYTQLCKNARAEIEAYYTNSSHTQVYIDIFEKILSNF